MRTTLARSQRRTCLTFAEIDRIVAAPRSVDLAVPGRLGPAGGLEPGDYALHVLHVVAMRHQQRVGGVHHHHILQSQQRDIGSSKVLQ